MKNLYEDLNVSLSHSERSHSIHFTLPEGDKHDTRNESSRKAPVSEESGVTSFESEATSQYKSRDSLKGFGK